MTRLAGVSRLPPLARARKGLAWMGGALAAAVAAALAAMLAVVFAATVVVIAVIASVLIAFAGLALRARRSAATPGDGATILEARNVGGHSWVAYGWDNRR
jgi:hypothetical protein